MTPLEMKINERMQNWDCSRLEAISSLDLGVRSLAAKRVIYKRERRKELMDKGFSFEEANIILRSDDI